MKVVIDMSLSPEWGEVFAREGWECVHWSEVGKANAPDREIMAWARENGHVVFTHDLDFGTLLATTQATGPSVVQIRAEDVRPAQMDSLVCSAIRAHTDRILAGALVTIDPRKQRATLLPLPG